ncbi:hypothetical protein Drorol1_Dr00015278 [Drosera rotundifolia]
MILLQNELLQQHLYQNQQPQQQNQLQLLQQQFQAPRVSGFNDVFGLGSELSAEATARAVSQGLDLRDGEHWLLQFWTLLCAICLCDVFGARSDLIYLSIQYDCICCFKLDSE